jgi:hypothetical protein
MNELTNPADDRDRGSGLAAPPLDAQLAELIEFVWACEGAARREDRIDAAVKYGRL